MKIIKKIVEAASAFGVIGSIKISLLHFLNKRKIDIGIRNSIKIWLREIREYIYIRPYTSDIELVIGIFCHRNQNGRHEYDIEWENKVNNPLNIIDAGANIGVFSMMYTKKFPDAKIVAFEPEDSNYQMLLKNTHKFKNIICVKAGIWCRDACLQVIPRATGKWGFYVKEITKNMEVGGGIKGMCLNTIMEQYEMDYIDILKMDIEGSELEVFSENTAWIDKTQVVIVETHERFRPESDCIVTKKLIDKKYCMEMNGENKVFWLPKINA